MQLLVRCMQERQLLLTLFHPSFDQSTFAEVGVREKSHLRPFHPPHQVAPQQPRIQQLDHSIEDMITSLIQSFSAETSENEIHEHRDLTIHVISMLRHASFWCLVSIGGWQASESEAERATAQMKAWIQTEPALSRKCLWHSAMVFGNLRLKRHFACYDPLSLCISVLYIQLYDHFTARTARHDIVSVSDASHHGPPLRLDRLKNYQALDLWIKHGGSARIHITGVGFLHTRETPTKIWTEYRKILMASSAWWGICRGLAWAAGRMMEGERPVYMDESDAPPPADMD